jgi:AP-1 complex subunit gamma-1
MKFHPRNVAKLLFINMLGHNTDFGQMECLKLITTANFSEKRIGYLGLTQLYNEKSELLMISKNILRIDLTNTVNMTI